MSAPHRVDLRPEDLDLGTDDITISDEKAFHDLRNRLLEDHTRWLAERHPGTDGFVAHQLLQLKWGYLDGHLGRWRVADVHEVLLGLFPRKIILDDEDLPDVVPSCQRFLEHLAEMELLAPDSDPLPRLLAGLDSVEDAFLAEMGDSANFGMAKSLFSGMAGADFDPTEPGALDALMQEFNSLPEDERERMLGPVPAPPPVAPMVLPDDDELAAHAMVAPAMRQVAAFLDWVGDGRALTQKGNLKLADGKQLVDLLGTRDRFDEVIGDRQFKTHSTTDLPEVDLVYRLALQARLARKHRGRVVRTKRGERLAQEPLEAWRAMVEAMSDIGMVGAGREDRYGLRWWEDYLEGGAVELVKAVAARNGSIPVEVLAETAYEGLAEAYDLEDLPERHQEELPRSVGWGVGRLVDRLVWLGAATRDGVVVEQDRFGYEERIGGEFALTDLGRWYARPLLEADGLEIPVVGDLADAPADVLLGTIGDWPLEAVHAEVRAWAAARDTAVDELAAFVQQASAPDLVALALEALEVIGDEAVPAVRGLLDNPRLRPWATLWLVQAGHEEMDAFSPGDAPAALLQAFAVGLIAGGPQEVVEMLPADMPVRARIALIESLWRVDDPYTAPVLEALADGAEKKVAKAARKALFKYRSAGGP